MATLTISTSEGEVAYELNQAHITLGRSDENAIVVDDESISGKHAELVLDDAGNYVVSDLGSTNGVKIGGQRITEPTALEHGIKVHPAFSVQYHPEAAPGPHDASYFFEEFAKLIEQSRVIH